MAYHNRVHGGSATGCKGNRGAPGPWLPEQPPGYQSNHLLPLDRLQWPNHLNFPLQTWKLKQSVLFLCHNLMIMVSKKRRYETGEY